MRRPMLEPVVSLEPPQESKPKDVLRDGVSKKRMHPFGNLDRNPHAESRTVNTGDEYIEGYTYGDDT